MKASDEIILDVTKFLCPISLLKSKQALKALLPGEVLRIVLHDTASIEDVRLLIESMEIVLLEEGDSETDHYFLVKKKE